jgi:hypothetical protein
MTDHTAQIIQFAARPKLGKKIGLSVPQLREPPRNEEGLTETCKNQRLRSDRLDAWRAADAVMDYWRAVMKMDSAISRVQNCEAPEGKLHPLREPKDHGTLIERYRLAWCHLMLTPAPDMRSVTWKQAQLKAENYKYTGLPPARIEQAIADDVEFLKAHPTRRRDLQQ